MKTPFSIATMSRYRGWYYSFHWIASLTLDLYLIILSVKQGGIKYHFLSLWYDSTWNWTPFSHTIGEHSNHYTNGLVKKFTIIIHICHILFLKFLNLKIMGARSKYKLFYSYLLHHICEVMTEVVVRSQGWPEGSLFDSYYTKVLGRVRLLSLDCSTLSLILTLWYWVLSKEASSTIFWVFGMIWPGIEPRSPSEHNRK